MHDHYNLSCVKKISRLLENDLPSIYEEYS